MQVHASMYMVLKMQIDVSHHFEGRKITFRQHAIHKHVYIVNLLFCVWVCKTSHPRNASLPVFFFYYLKRVNCYLFICCWVFFNQVIEMNRVVVTALASCVSASLWVL